jgi:hypothetical protein
VKKLCERSCWGRGGRASAGVDHEPPRRVSHTSDAPRSVVGGFGGRSFMTFGGRWSFSVRPPRAVACGFGGDRRAVAAHRPSQRGAGPFSSLWAPPLRACRAEHDDRLAYSDLFGVRKQGAELSDLAEPPRKPLPLPATPLRPLAHGREHRVTRSRQLERSAACACPLATTRGTRDATGTPDSQAWPRYPSDVGLLHHGHEVRPRGRRSRVSAVGTPLAE